MSTITKERMKEIRDFDTCVTLEESAELARIALASLEAGSDSNSHPAHGPLSNYRLYRIREILSKAAAQRDGGNLGYGMSDAVKAIDELLEGRKVEPVAWTDEEELRDVRRVGFGEMFSVEPISPNADMCRVIPLYTAPPAPVVPATLPCAVELKPGLIIGKGCKTETLLTVLQRRADYYAEIDAMTPEERAEHDANIEAFKAMLPQPTPVVPEEATPKNIEMLASARVRNVTFQWDEDERNAAADSWNACRAAVLKEGQILSDSDVNRFGKFLAKKDGVGI
ncbi:hypothetical protein OGW21_04035 [Citrobacter sp. CK190]|nr:hypothetical protein [Citrobacter sp. CK190]MDM2989511.1 hypothetical protein [Citrobacter sp. CK190]